MNQRLLFALLIGGALWWWHHDHRERTRPAPPPLAPAPPANPKPKPKPEPKNPKKPWGPGPCPAECGPEAGGRPVEGERVSPDGAVELVCDLPASERKKNIASKGLGCCVFRSIDYAARWQRVPELYDLPEQLVQAGVPGGGYPEKVDEVLARFGPGVSYLQDTSGDADILEAILKTGRMPCVTYNGHDCHYSGSIAHMVCLPYFDRQTGWACVSDNNFPGADQLVWMSPDDFLKRWKGGGGGGWVFALLAPPPPLPPHN
ncbi:MAG TPA: hypothetical protein VMF69_08195 [Gemmataceae bacterium]|nr:hypothetical protein [Gemmataceae bacterium]